MTGFALVDWGIGAIVALAGALGLFAGARKTLADARATRNPTTPYEALERRVMNLEESDADKGRELSRLRTQFRRLAGALTNEVAVILRWMEDGSPPPPPDREARIIRALIRDIDNDMQD